MNVADLSPAVLETLLRELPHHLPHYLTQQRWFGGKARIIHRLRVRDWLALPALPASNAKSENATHRPFMYPVGPRTAPLFLGIAILEVAYEDGGSERYSLPLAICNQETSLAPVLLRQDLPGGPSWTVCEATRMPAFWWALFTVLLRTTERACLTEGGSSWQVVHTTVFSPDAAATSMPQDIRIYGGEQSQSLAVLQHAWVLKLFRRLEEGISPDWEITRYLTEEARFPHTPMALAAWLYRESAPEEQSSQGRSRACDENTTLLAMMTRYRSNRGDAWSCTLAELHNLCQQVLQGGHFAPQPDNTPRPCTEQLWALTQQSAPDAWPELLRPQLGRLTLLGRRTAEMHLALAHSALPAFCPEPWTATDQKALMTSCSQQLSLSLELLRMHKVNLPPTVGPLAEAVLHLEAPLRAQLSQLEAIVPGGLKIRIHGDYHLGQVLCTEDDFVILDFEGEPVRPLVERRQKQAPLRDLAGMIRSFHYAAVSAEITFAYGLPDSQRIVLGHWLQHWYLWSASAFLRGYIQTPNISQILPPRARDILVLLNAFLIEKAAYELAYELNHRPDWIAIPLRGLHDLAASTALKNMPS
ncbi:MAG: hypothetical protein RMJ19_00910 [Gemmatales bacterium]|nr:hypothetical protein [Gemmatales bacterium]MCS7159005.1 hypothetical protein [Gemmatales bacterium]MDW8174205.1 hypothetical protein [Gemmatales bacterium]MDW8222232.1 hypothetical protein [Gemmatales bacterium]